MPRGLHARRCHAHFQFRANLKSLFNRITVDLCLNGCRRQKFPTDKRILQADLHVFLLLIKGIV